MEWHFRNDQPIYTQLTQQITLAILSGSIPSGGRLPTVRELAADAAVNPNTMQKAMAELEREGLLYSQRTAGRFVAGQEEIREGLKKELMMEYVEEFLDKMKKLGISVEEVIALLQENEEK